MERDDCPRDDDVEEESQWQYVSWDEHRERFQHHGEESGQR